MSKTIYSKINYRCKYWETYFIGINKKFTRNFAKIIFALFLFSVSNPLKLIAQDPGKGGTQAGFQVDADFFSSTIPAWWIGSGANQNYFPNKTISGADWSGANAVLKQSNGVSIPGTSDDNRAVWRVDGNWGGSSPVAEAISFKGNSNKNSDNIAAGQSPYLLQEGGSGPQKNDITNTYLYSKQVMVGTVSHTWLFFGAETRATKGNSYIDFEYNQAGVTTTTGLRLVGNGPVGGRSVGDFVLVVNYTGGGNRPIIGVRTWQASGTWSEELPVNSSQFITTNSEAVDPVAPNKAFASDGAYANTVMALQFMEGGVDITALDIAELDLCTAGATVTIKTRSSSSFTAELKDLDVVPFALLPPSDLTDPTDLTKCPTENAVFSTTASGEGALASNIKWYKVTGTAPNEVETEITTGISTSGLTSTLTISNVAAANAGIYRARMTGATCGEPEEDVTLTVNTTAALTELDPQTKCVGTSASATFSTTVSGTGATATNVEWYFGTTKLSNGTKYTIGTSGSTSTLTINGIAVADGGTYTAKLTNATCGAPEKSNTLTVNTTAELTALSPQTKCPGTTESATFSSTVSGTGATSANVEWYFGTTKLSNGSKYTIGTSGNTSTLTINGILEADEGTYKAKLVNATCGTPERTSTLTVHPTPDADAGTNPAVQCYKAAGNEFSLDGSNSTNGTALWTRVSPATLPDGITVTFDNNESFTPKVTVSGASEGIIVTLRLTVTSNLTPSCGNDFDDVSIEVKAQAEGKDGEILPITCTDLGFNLKISSPDAGTIYTVTQPCNPAYSSTGAEQNDGSLLFTGLKFAAGYKIIADINGCEAAPVICPGTCSDICAPNTIANQQQVVKPLDINARIASPTKVIAAPNPFNDKIRFTLESEVSGNGSLELFNTLGQKVKTVFQGRVEAGKMQTIEYNVPGSQRSNLIYVFRVGEQKTTGKLIGLQ